MVTYVVDLKKLMKKTSKFLRNKDVPLHFSKSKNEIYNLHQMLVLYVLFCLVDVAIDRFGELIKIADLNKIGMKKAPHYSTMWRAWRRFSPSFLRKLVRLSGKGGRDKCIALDPTHFEITKPSVAYCKRIKRNLMQEPNRKTTIATGTRSLRIADAIMSKNSHRHGLDDFEKMAGDWMKNKTIVADTEFDAEERFHKIIITKPALIPGLKSGVFDRAGFGIGNFALKGGVLNPTKFPIKFGGKGVAPLRHKNIPIWRTKGSRRKELRRKWPGRSYHRRPMAETINSMLKRGMSAFLRGRTVWQQQRHFYAKCFAHNMIMRCQE